MEVGQNKFLEAESRIHVVVLLCLYTKLDSLILTEGNICLISNNWLLLLTVSLTFWTAIHSPSSLWHPREVYSVSLPYLVCTKINLLIYEQRQKSLLFWIKDRLPSFLFVSWLGIQSFVVMETSPLEWFINDIKMILNSQNWWDSYFSL